MLHQQPVGKVQPEIFAKDPLGQEKSRGLIHHHAKENKPMTMHKNFIDQTQEATVSVSAAVPEKAEIQMCF